MNKTKKRPRQLLKHYAGKRTMFYAYCEKFFVGGSGHLHAYLGNVIRWDSEHLVSDHIVIVEWDDVEKLIPYEGQWILFSAYVYTYTNKQNQPDYSLRHLRSISSADHVCQEKFGNLEIS